MQEIIDFIKTNYPCAVVKAVIDTHSHADHCGGNVILQKETGCEVWTSKGWTMRIDGEEKPLLRADYLLRAAMVPAGQHEIVMRYEPRIWKVGGIISLVSSLVILLGLVGTIVISLIKKQKAPAKA